MKNLFICLIVIYISFTGSVLAKKNLALYDFYVRNIDGNYTLITALNFDFGNCYPSVQENCAYYHFRDNTFLPSTLTSQQVYNLSHYEPITLRVVVDVLQIPVKGYYNTD